MSNAVYGYVRTSTMKQNKERQVSNILEKYPEAVIISESYTGTKMDRPEWSRLYKSLKAGDTVVFDEVSRLARNAGEGFGVYVDLYRRGVNLVFLKEPYINTATYTEAAQMPPTGNADFDETLGRGINEFLMRLDRRQIQQAFEQAQGEVERLHKRTSEGVREAAKRWQREEVLGQPHQKNLPGRQAGTSVVTKKEREAKELIRKYSKDFNGSLSDDEARQLVRIDNGDGSKKPISRNSYYKYKKALKAELEAAGN